jgi:hypothetical protein
MQNMKREKASTYCCLNKVLCQLSGRGGGGKEGGGSIGKQWENSVEVTLFKFMESQLKKTPFKVCVQISTVEN